MRFILSPNTGLSFDKLGINPDQDINLNVNLDSMEEAIEMSNCFAEKQQATVFHVHEVMRLALQNVSMNNNAEESTFHTNSVRDRFNLLSYHASIVWQNWQNAFEDAGDSVQAILQRIFGVRIRSNGRWIPHNEGRFVTVGDEGWAIIDDIIPSADYIENFGMENLWFSADTGLRLIRTSEIPAESEKISFGDLMGESQRFPSASSWLQWCVDNGTPRDSLPTGQGNAYYFRGMKSNDEVPRYRLDTKRDPPLDWWSRNPLDELETPFFRIDEKSWCFGCLWDYDDEREYWKVTWPHLLSKEGEIIVISRNGLGIDVPTDEEDKESDLLSSSNPIWDALNKDLREMHLRAIRILLIKANLAPNPDPVERNIAQLGLGYSAIESPYSDWYFIRPPNNYGKPTGVIIGSPIELTIRKSILRMNWYGEN